MNKLYSEDYCVRQLSRKKGININVGTKEIKINKNATDVGKGSWGKIDYLHKVHDYFYSFYSGEIINNTNSNNTITKADKRESKLNMSRMVKNSMRQAKS